MLGRRAKKNGEDIRMKIEDILVLENRNPGCISKLGCFAYCLNPDDPDYRIYRIISISIVAHIGTLCRAYDFSSKHVAFNRSASQSLRASLFSILNSQFKNLNSKKEFP